jgi:hypothetical protein
MHKTDQCAAHGHRRNIRSRRHRDVLLTYVNVSQAAVSVFICSRWRFLANTPTP